MTTVKSLIYALLMALLIKYSVIEAYNVPTGSMEDTILVGDFLLANKFIYGVHIPLVGITLPGLRDPEPGDVVVFKFPGDPNVNYVKRCIAVGGQVVTVKDTIVFVDGEPIPDYPNVKFKERPNPSARHGFGPYRVPEDCYFMMGDNRDDSYDSRYWGVVKQEYILGKALVIHWSWGDPPDPEAPRWEFSDPLGWPSSIWYNFIHFHERVRWDRLGTVIN